MVTLSKLQRTTQEFIKEGKLHEYSDEVAAIIKKVDIEGCAISCHYRPDESSSHSFAPDSNYIRIAMLDKSESVHVIWDILHEFGHFLSGRPEKQGPDLNRELLAWDYAERELEDYPKLKIHSANFYAYKEHCLEDYRKLDALGRK